MRTMIAVLITVVCNEYKNPYHNNNMRSDSFGWMRKESGAARFAIQ